MPDKLKELKDLNPQITDAEIGVRNLRNIVIYPLSVGNQLRATDLITDAVNTFMGTEDQSDIATVTMIVNLIKNNIQTILGFVTDEEVDTLLDDMTNDQMVKIVTVIYEVNFEKISKNLKGLFEKAKEVFPSERPLQQFVNTMGDTDLNTSSSGDTKTEG